MPQLPVMHRGDDLDEICAALHEHGGVIIEDFLDADTVDALNREMGPKVDADDPTARTFINPFIADFFGTKVKHLTGLASQSETFVDEVLLHPLYDAINAKILGPSCAEWQLNIAHLLQRGPGAEQQYIHRDQDVWNFLPKPHPEIEVASLVALTPTESDWRRGFHLSFVVGWLRTAENNILATPPDAARKLPLRAQELIGYKAHDAIATGGGYLGVLDVRHPTELLASGEL